MAAVRSLSSLSVPSGLPSASVCSSLELGSAFPCGSFSFKQAFSRGHNLSPRCDSSRRLAVKAAASERPLWFPGSPPPAYLDGKLAGDFGFDPLGLGSDPEDLRWYVQAELVHSRFAMLGVAGILFTDLLRVTGLKDLPVWYEAGAVKYEIADPVTLFAVQLLLFGFVETKRWMDFIKPGSQASESSWFFGIEEAFAGYDNGYPGGPLFDPFGLARNEKMGFPMKVKEIKNGRLAMLAALGIFVQAYYTHQGPIENLISHISDPGHSTIIQTLSN